jgi:DNA-binding transcriptional LysR family regulator
MPFTAIFPKAINTYRKQFPHVTLLLQEMSTMRQIAAINDRALDLGFLRPPEVEIPGSVSLTTLHHYPLAVIMPVRHRLARKTAICIEDLANEDFVMFPHDEGTTLYPQIFRLCRDAGFEPKVTMEAREAPTIIGLVAAGCGISILPDLFKCIRIKDVCYRPIQDSAAATKLMLANRMGESTPLINSFLEVAVNAAGL